MWLGAQCFINTFSSYFCLSKKIRLDFSCEQQWIHLKYQVLFSLKNNVKRFMSAVCCSRDRPLRVKFRFLSQVFPFTITPRPLHNEN